MLDRKLQLRPISIKSVQFNFAQDIDFPQIATLKISRQKFSHEYTYQRNCLNHKVHLYHRLNPQYVICCGYNSSTQKNGKETIQQIIEFFHALNIP